MPATAPDSSKPFKVPTGTFLFSLLTLPLREGLSWYQANADELDGDAERGNPA
jgi:hypothetical protein